MATVKTMGVLRTGEALEGVMVVICAGEAPTETERLLLDCPLMFTVTENVELTVVNLFVWQVIWVADDEITEHLVPS